MASGIRAANGAMYQPNTQTNSPMTKRKQKAVKAWGGFIDDRLDTWCAVDTSLQFAVFRNRREAAHRYEDVRAVTITPTHGKQRRGK